ncbi:MAG: acid phosphatase [Opitutaceae bacterium]|nr:acid phosphatase [Opitutaceae bacterium]
MVGLAVAGTMANIAFSEPPNLSRAKAAVIKYHDNGNYLRDVARVADWATAWIEQRAAMRQPGERLLVVFDVDETVLSNYPQMIATDFGYEHDEWVIWVEKAAAPAIVPMREVYETARRLGVDVVFLTGRRAPEEVEGTVRNLELQGMGEYEKIIFQGAEDTADTAAERKLLRRIQLEKAGWTIIASLGDQGSDLAGRHAERIFKLPNPFYEVP